MRPPTPWHKLETNLAELAALLAGTCVVASRHILHQWWYNPRVSMAHYMSEKSPTPWPAFYDSLTPPTPCHKLETYLVELLIRGWDVVPAILDINGRYSDVSASLTTCRSLRGVTHTCLGTPYLTC